MDFLKFVTGLSLGILTCPIILILYEYYKKDSNETHWESSVKKRDCIEVDKEDNEEVCENFANEKVKKNLMQTTEALEQALMRVKDSLKRNRGKSEIE